MSEESKQELIQHQKNELRGMSQKKLHQKERLQVQKFNLLPKKLSLILN